MTIVEHARDAEERVPRWVVGPEPALAIGVADGNAGYQFHYALDAAFLPDGRIAVLDWGSRQVRLFDGEGGLVGVQGRPREAGDHVTAGRGRPRPGSAAGGPGPALRRGHAGPAPDGRPLGPLHRRPRRRLSHGVASGWATAKGDRLAYGTGQASRVVMAEVRWPGPGGEVDDVRAPERSWRTRRIVRWHGPDRAVTDEDVRVWIDSMVARTRPERRPLERRRWEATPVAEAKPAHGRLLFDAAGRLWVNRWDLWADHLNDGPGWWVFDREGRMVATARMPAGFRAFDIGEDAVLGRVRDPMGVERVVVMPLRMEASGPGRPGESAPARVPPWRRGGYRRTRTR